MLVAIFTIAASLWLIGILYGYLSNKGYSDGFIFLLVLSGFLITPLMVLLIALLLNDNSK